MVIQGQLAPRSTSHFSGARVSPADFHMYPRGKWQLIPHLDICFVFQLATKFGLLSSTHLFNYFLQAKAREHQRFDVDRDVKKLNKACKGMGRKYILFANLLLKLIKFDLMSNFPMILGK